MKPVLVFLHGLLGTQADWQHIIQKLPHFSCLALDLPFHGSAKHQCVSDFEQTAQYIAAQIKLNIGEQPYVLVGYSLGGRIALYYALQAQVDKSWLRGLIIESANLGLERETEKHSRWQNDLAWAMRFANETPEQVLEDWYKQPVFAHLTTVERQALILKRKANCGVNIAKMLQATSLAKQPNFSEKVRLSSLPFFYFCGERDRKFQAIARQHQLNLILIPNAGHNAHLENPKYFSKKLENCVLKIAQL